jgi:hypothetical protein
MKKIYSKIALLAISSLVLLSSCSKDGEDDVINPVTPDATVELNENTKPSASTNLYVKRDQASATLQVSAVSKTSTDMKRVYVFKKSETTTNVGTYTTVEGSGFKKDGNNNFYYDLPADQKNNAVITLTVSLNANNTAAVKDEYFFVFTTGSAYDGAPNIAGVLVGPAQVYINYGILNETTGHKLNNILGPNSGAFDLVALTNKSTSDADASKDLVDHDKTTALWDKSFKAANDTKFTKVSSTFDYANATDIAIKNAYDADNASGTVSSVAAGDLYVAKLRGLDQYALIKVTFISTDTDGEGSGKNNEYMEFSVKK